MYKYNFIENGVLLYGISSLRGSLCLSSGLKSILKGQTDEKGFFMDKYIAIRGYSY